MPEPHQPEQEENPKPLVEDLKKGFADLRANVGRAERCPRCEMLIMVQTGLNAEKEFEAQWEAHRGFHKKKDEEAELAAAGELEPTAEQLAAANVKAKADAAQLERMFKNNDDHLRDLEGHFDSVSRIEHKLPQLIDFGFKWAEAVRQWCKEKDWRPKSLATGNIFWAPAGDVAVEFSYDKYDISSPEQPEYLKKGYARLPKLHDQHPALFEVVMTLGEHLVNICEQKRLTKKDLTFRNLHHFVNPNNSMDMWAFRIVNHKAVLKASRIKF